MVLSSRHLTILPSEGGFKYNPPNGGPADIEVTSWIETIANKYLEDKLKGVRRMPIVKPTGSHDAPT